jgi:TonB family protein
MIPEILSALHVDKVAFNLGMQPVSLGIQRMESQLMSQDNQQIFTVFDIAFGLYLLGVCILVWRFVKGLIKIFRLSQSGMKVSFKGGTLIFSSYQHAPFSFFNMLFIPEDHGYSKLEFEQILKHEIVHMKAKHSIDILIIELLCAVFWVNPIVYFYRRALKNAHEFIADRLSVSTDSFAKYGRLLLSHYQPGLEYALASQFFQSQLKIRFKMMTKTQSRSWKKIKYLMLIPMTIIALTFFSFQDQKYINENEQDIIADTIPTYSLESEVDEMPRFPGCEDINDMKERASCAQKRMLTYIFTQIRYPEEARKKGVQGMVIAEFFVEDNGTISGAKILQDIGSGCGQEVLRVISGMNNMDEQWKPGLKDENPVRTRLTIPVSFKLDNNDQKKPEQSQNPNKKLPANTGIEQKENDYRESYKVIEQMPRFPGCEDQKAASEQLYKCSQQKLLEFVYNRLEYPKKAKDENIEGTVVVQFVVYKNGTIGQFAVVQSVSDACDKEVLRVMRLMQQQEEPWTPGMQRGKPIAVEYLLPVKFKLDNKEKPMNH